MNPLLWDNEDSHFSKEKNKYRYYKIGIINEFLLIHYCSNWYPSGFLNAICLFICSYWLLASIFIGSTVVRINRTFIFTFRKEIIKEIDPYFIKSTLVNEVTVILWLFKLLLVQYSCITLRIMFFMLTLAIIHLSIYFNLL